LHAQRPTLIEKLLQRLLDTRLPFLDRQLQQANVLAIPVSRWLPLQRIISPPKRERRIQVLSIHVTRKCTRLPRQTVNHVPIVDAMFRLATQAFHRLHQRTRVPDLDHLGTDPCFQPLAQQPCRHRVDILFHHDRAALAHAHPLTFRALQALRRQGTQQRLLFSKPRCPPGILPLLHATHELPVRFPTAEVTAVTQQQFLLQRLLEAAMTLLAIAVLVAAGGIGRLGRQTVVTHQRLVPARVLLGGAVLMHGQRHAVGTMPLRHPAQFPQGVLQPLTQAGEAFRKAQAHMFPVGARQHEVVDHVRKRLARNGHAQTVHVAEVRRAQSTRLMDLAEKHFLGWPVLGFPLPHAPFHGPALPLPVLTRIVALQPSHQRFGLQGWLTLEKFFQAGPNCGQRVGAGSPRVRPADFAGQSALAAILACGFAIHTCLHRCPAQRPSLV